MQNLGQNTVVSLSNIHLKLIGDGSVEGFRWQYAPKVRAESLRIVGPESFSAILKKFAYSAAFKVFVGPIEWFHFLKDFFLLDCQHYRHGRPP
jgi:hypothetical protein